MYSTQVSEQKSPSKPGLPQSIIDATYGFFFKFAPALAGAEEGSRGTSNEQFVDLLAGKVFNSGKLHLKMQS